MPLVDALSLRIRQDSKGREFRIGDLGRLRAALAFFPEAHSIVSRFDAAAAEAAQPIAEAVAGFIGGEEADIRALRIKAGTEMGTLQQDLVTELRRFMDEEVQRLIS